MFSKHLWLVYTLWNYSFPQLTSSSLVNSIYLHTSSVSLALHRPKDTCPPSGFKQMPRDCSLQQSVMILSSFSMLCIAKYPSKQLPLYTSLCVFANECISLPLPCLYQARSIGEISKNLKAVKDLNMYESLWKLLLTLHCWNFPRKSFYWWHSPKSSFSSHTSTCQAACMSTNYSCFHQDTPG